MLGWSKTVETLLLSHLGPFFRLFYQGLKKLPQKTLEAGRGVLVSGIPVLENCFNSPPSVGGTLSFWGVSSFSVEDCVANQYAEEDAILYLCESLCCVSLERFSLNPREAAVIPLLLLLLRFFFFFFLFSFGFILFSFLTFFFFFQVHSSSNVGARKLVLALAHDVSSHSKFSYV